ncbi:hypothetical protein HN748_04765 [Candidatus Peregrinibacteria bacterium]|jgi:hypothetical protein|nr:hypothetical protein [Candidatus Peregrinibacteria bacterium]MBT7484158.1 hypothetical protein [Candidatus Peregrinibacteria bacterium]MBT7703522.1 hypothetical protein [Candidatus Peregrinibacteria bacterium]
MLASIMFRAYLNPGEKILYVAHVHPFTIYKSFLKHLFFGFALPGLFYLMMPPFWIVWASWGGIGALYMLLFYLDWYFDAILVTNQTIIDLEWTGIFKRSSSRVEYHTIEGVAYEVNGFWATVLNYGDLAIDRIGTGSQIGLKDVSFPKTAEREIMSAQNDFMRNKSFREHQTLKDLLAGMLQDYSNK